MIAIRSIILTITLLLSTGALCAQPASEPATVVGRLYDNSIQGADAAFGLRKSDRRILSRSLNRLWSKADAAAKKRGDEVGPVDFDVVSMSQDPNIKSYAVIVEKQDDKTAIIAARFVVGENNVKTGETVVVRYDFIHEQGRWLIDDLHSSIHGKPYSLRSGLEASFKK